LKTQKEQLVADTYQSWKEVGNDVSYAKIAAEFGVNRHTICQRVLSMGLLLSESNTSKQKLTPAEEEVLVTSILEASQHGFPPTHHQISMEANYIQSTCLAQSYQPIGKKWVDEFIQHHNKVTKTHWSTLLSTFCA
jgi:hypothetical protein